MKSSLAKWLFGLAGWSVSGNVSAEVPKAILVVAPHTSNWDFVVGVFARAITGMKIKYVGKASLFKPPFGWLFRWLGGYPVDRIQQQDTVKFVIELFNRHEKFLFAISPEGTRKKTDRLRTGFYNIALGAKIPIVLVGFDYRMKKVSIYEPYWPTGDREADFEYFLSYFRTVTGKHPEMGIDY
ncbi:MAG: 1-acyl-sn-glycerol-3-phosphate acyltransferase [Bacteroidia bacterium]